MDLQCESSPEDAWQIHWKARKSTINVMIISIKNKPLISIELYCRVWFNDFLPITWDGTVLEPWYYDQKHDRFVVFDFREQTNQTAWSLRFNILVDC